MKKIIWIFILLFMSASIVYAQRDNSSTIEYRIIRESDTQIRLTRVNTIENDLILTIKELRNNLRELNLRKNKLDRDYQKATEKIDIEIIQAQFNLDEAIRLGVIEE